MAQVVQEDSVSISNNLDLYRLNSFIDETTWWCNDAVLFCDCALRFRHAPHAKVEGFCDSETVARNDAVDKLPFQQLQLYVEDRYDIVTLFEIPLYV